MTTQTYSPGLEGVIAGTTQIAQIDPDRQSLVYRGYDIRELAERSTFEEVSYLLLHGELPTKSELDSFKQTLVQERQLSPQLVDILRQLPKNADMMDVLKAATALLSLYDSEVRMETPEAMMRKAIRLMAKFPTIVAYGYRLTRGQEIVEPADGRLSHAENFLYMFTGKEPSPLLARTFDVSLIAYAEHGFNASTFTGRVISSTLSDIHSAVVGGIGALKGRLHGGANEEAMKMLLEIKTVEAAEPWIRNAIAEKKKVMGFGHREYKSGDPRAKILNELGRQMSQELGNTQWYDIAAIVERVMVDEKNIHPNVDFPTAYIYYLMGLPIEIYTPIFAIARIVGWSAHVLEQKSANRLIRPKAIYEGSSYREYVPVDAR